MATPGEDIDAFLEGSGMAESQRLDVAIMFASAMLRELRASVAEWEQTATALRGIKQHQQQQQTARGLPEHPARGEQ